MSNKPSSNLWIARPASNPQARVRLFCLPFAGGGASAFRSWQKELPADVEICAVQLPGRENRMREPAFTRLDQLVDAMGIALRPYFDRPFAIFGHSMGALLAFELAMRLRAIDGISPLHLFVSGHRAPQIPDPDPLVYQLPDEEFIAEIRRLNGTPEAVLQHAELMQLVLPILRADFELLETYQYTAREPLDCPLTAFGGLTDPEVGREDLAAWREQTRRQFALHMFPGDHFYLLGKQAPLLQSIAQSLQRRGGG